ncbi:hypothetical protein TWF696_006749 [Orbilia brochopaga]|uniref:Uncharacterized protein n=1 Tax=Orbilia brochopaga TaxID=3140254 RepID=A0AAV9UQX1_9PEZI
MTRCGHAAIVKLLEHDLGRGEARATMQRDIENLKSTVERLVSGLHDQEGTNQRLQLSIEEQLSINQILKTSIQEQRGIIATLELNDKRQQDFLGKLELDVQRSEIKSLSMGLGNLQVAALRLLFRIFIKIRNSLAHKDWDELACLLLKPHSLLLKENWE